MAFSNYDYGFDLCFHLCIQQGYPGDPGLPGPLQFHNGNDSRGETTSVTTLSLLVELLVATGCTILLYIIYLKYDNEIIN